MRYLVIILLTLVPSISFAQDMDLPVIELLIDAHKKMKRAEDLAVLELEAIKEEHSLTTKATKAYNKARTVINKRMDDLNAMQALIGRILGTSLKISDILMDYKDFTVNTYNLALKKPYLLYYYGRANYELKRDVEFMVKTMSIFTVSGGNLIKATMEEKYRMLNSVDLCLARISRTLNRYSFMCKVLTRTGLKVYNVLEIVNDKTNKDLINKYIDKWKQNAGLQPES